MEALEDVFVGVDVLFCSSVVSTGIRGAHQTMRITARNIK